MRYMKVSRWNSALLHYSRERQMAVKTDERAPHLHHDAQILDVVLLRLNQLVQDKPAQKPNTSQITVAMLCGGAVR